MIFISLPFHASKAFRKGRKIKKVRADARTFNYLWFVGVTGFEPATTRPPDVDSTGLSYAPISGDKSSQKVYIMQKFVCFLSYTALISYIRPIFKQIFSVKGGKGHGKDRAKPLFHTWLSLRLFHTCLYLSAV